MQSKAKKQAKAKVGVDPLEQKWQWMTIYTQVRMYLLTQVLVILPGFKRLHTGWHLGVPAGGGRRHYNSQTSAAFKRSKARSEQQLQD